MKNFFSKLETGLSCMHHSGGLIADFNTPFHCHDGYEILIFLGGDISFFVEQHCISLTPGDIVCCPPYTFHRAVPNSEQSYERVLLNISEACLQKQNSPHTNLAGCFYEDKNQFRILRLAPYDLETLLQYTNRLEACLAGQTFGCDVLQNALLVEILVLLNRQTDTPGRLLPSGTQSPLVTKILTYIEEHFREDFHMEQLAAELHHNADYLTRCFKKATGCSIQQFLIAKRINNAQRLLREGSNPCDVCYLSGFDNYSNFSRTFTKHTGTSPKQYQRSRS